MKIYKVKNKESGLYKCIRGTYSKWHRIGSFYNRMPTLKEIRRITDVEINDLIIEEYEIKLIKKYDCFGGELND